MFRYIKRTLSKYKKEKTEFSALHSIRVVKWAFLMPSFLRRSGGCGSDFWAGNIVDRANTETFAGEFSAGAWHGDPSLKFNSAWLSTSFRLMSVLYTLSVAHKIRKGSIMSAMIRNPTRIEYWSHEKVWKIHMASMMKNSRVNAWKLNR